MARGIRKELPDGWIVTYKLGRDSLGATVITGLSVKASNGIPDGGLTAQALRHVPMGMQVTARTWADVNEEFSSYDELHKSGRTYGELRSRDITPDAAPRRGRRHDESFLLLVAQAWDRAIRSGTRDLYAGLIAELHRQGYDYSRSGARSLVDSARDRGLLERTSKGRPGGRLTNYARKLLGEL